MTRQNEKLPIYGDGKDLRAVEDWGGKKEFRICFVETMSRIWKFAWRKKREYTDDSNTQISNWNDNI